MNNKIAFLLGRLTGFIFKLWRLILLPIKRYQNRRRYKKELAKLNQGMINLISVLANKLTPVMTKTTFDMLKLSEDYKHIEVSK